MLFILTKWYHRCLHSDTKLFTCSTWDDQPMPGICRLFIIFDLPSLNVLCLVIELLVMSL